MEAAVEIYTVVAFTESGVQRKFITPPNWEIRRGSNRVYEYNKRPRTFTVIGQARTYRKRLLSTVLTEGDCRILRVRIYANGDHDSAWVE